MEFPCKPSSFKEILKMLISSDESQPLTFIDQRIFSPPLGGKEEHLTFCNALLASPSSSLKELHVFDRIGNDVDGEVAACYARLLTATPSLEYLSFKNTNLGGEGFRLILHSSSSIANISHLSFSTDKSIGKEGMLHLAPILPSISNLRSLTLQDVGIDEKGAALLAEALLTNNALLSLNMSRNKIGDLGAEHIARMLQSNNTLQTLDMSWNKIGDLGAEHIARMLQSNSTLQTLNMSLNEIGDLVAERIARMLQSNNTLQTLNMSLNEIGDLVAERIARMLQSYNTLQTLNMSLNEIGDLVAERIARMLQSYNTLQTLNMSLNEIGDLVAERIARMLQSNNTLQTLDMSRNKIGDLGAEHIASMLQSNNTLQTLNMSLNEIGDLVLEHIARMLQSNNTLQTLNMSVNEIGDLGAEHIARMLQSNNTLQTLDMSSNKIGDLGVEHIARMLQSNNTLQTLDMSSNKIGDLGVEHIARMLQSNNTLQTLNMSVNEIGDLGAEHIARMLQSNNTLQTLYMYSNKIGDLGAEHIARMLQSNNTLQTLHMSWNKIGDLGAEHIARMLQSNNTLQTLDMSGNELGDLGVEHIARMLQSNTTLQTLDISSDEIADFGEEHIARMLRIAKMLQSNNTSQTLHISYYKIGDLGVGHIALMLQSNTTLRTVRVRGNWGSVLPSAEKNLAITLEHNNALLILDISSNWGGIGEEDLELMFVNSHITALRHPNSPRIFMAYANILRRNTTLTTLNLSYNEETEPSRIEELFKAIAQNRSLHSLSLRGCKAVRGHKLVSCILDALRANSWLTHLDLEDTPLHREGQTAVIEAQVKRIKEENLLGFPQMLKAEPKSIRVFFCGLPYAGKTTLMKSMICASKGILQSALHSFSNGRLHSRTGRTRGIDIECIPYSGISISFWDLAGQEDYYSFHDFMFPNISHVGSSSLFFIVCNPMGRDGTKKTIEWMKQEVRYWMQFISSKAMPSKMFKASVVIVFTHKDKRPHSNKSSMDKLVHDISLDFQDCLDLCHYAFNVNARSPRSSFKILKYVHHAASNILKKCHRTYSCCNEVSHLLNIWKEEHLCTPMMHILDFIDLCNNVLELKEKSTPCSVAASSLSNEQKLVAHTLNAIGDILYFPDLEYVVVDLQWFCKSIIGQMIDCEDMPNQINVDQRGLIGWVKFEEIVSKSFSNERETRDVKRDAKLIIKIMQKLNLCFMGGTSEAVAHDILIPANLKPADNQSWKLNIRSEVIKVIKLGRRLQCLDQDHTILTPNFFPQIQVSLYNSFAEDHNIKFELQKDFISIIFEQHPIMEIHLEFHGPGIYDLLNSCSKDDKESECPPSYIDVLVQSPLDISETLKYLQDTIIKKIRDFCASWRGCQGVALVEGILRSDCVEQPEKYKNKECVLISTLEENLLKIPISDMPKNMYCWKEYYSSQTIPVDETKELMGEEAFMDVMNKRMEGVQAVAAELEAETEIHKEQQPLSSAETSRGALDRPLATNETNILSSEETLQRGGQRFAIEESGIYFESLKEFISTNLGRVKENICEKVDMVGEKVDRVDEKVEELGKKIDKLICIEEKVVDNLRTQIRALLDMVNRPALEHKIPHLFYFTPKTDGMREKVAKLVPSLDYYRLRFYCEGLPPLSSSSSSSAISTSTGSRKHHEVEDGHHEGLLLCCLKSKRLQKAIPYLNKVLKLVTMVVKVGAHVVAGAGDLVPDLAKLPALVFDSAVVNVVSLKLEELDPQVLQTDAALQNQSAEQWLVDILKENCCFTGKAIADSFGLYRVGHKNSSKISWVCKAHKDHSGFYHLPLH